MKVLITSSINAQNKYIHNLIKSLELNGICVDCSIQKFWNLTDLNYDILFLQWPEELFNWEKINISKIISLEERLKFWSKHGVKRIITRHNIFPHRNRPNDIELYQTVYKNIDGVVHMGYFSQHEFIKRYPEIKVRHAVIPHPMYTFDSKISKREARSKFQIDSETIIFLVCGSIRKFKEQNIIIQAFKKIQCPVSAQLIFTRGGYKFPKPNGRKKPLLRIFWETLFFIYKKRLEKYNIKIYSKFFSENDLNTFIKASDIMVIPRIKNLNSGLLPLAFSHRKVTIGSLYGNTGEILKSTKNPVFDPTIPETICEAFESAIKLNSNRKGDLNFYYARKNWNLNKIGYLLYLFFNENK